MLFRRQTHAQLRVWVWLLAGLISLAACTGIPTTTGLDSVPTAELEQNAPVNTTPIELPIRNGDLHFERISLDQGLSESVVNTIVQDQMGFMWFGTQDGLNQYNGHNFTVYRHDPSDPTSLSHNNISTLYVDQGGTLWVGTHSGGLNRYDARSGTFTHYRHLEQDPNSLGSDLVRAIYEDRQGNLWIGTGEAGLDRFDPKTGTFTHFRHDPDDPNSLAYHSVMAIYQDSAGRLWVGTPRGLDLLDPQTGDIHHYKIYSEGTVSADYNSVRVIFEDHAGNLWIGTQGGGLNRLDPKSGGVIHYLAGSGGSNHLSGNRVYAILEDRAGVLWVGTQTGGLNAYDPEASQFTAYGYDPFDTNSLSNNTVISIYEDASGVLWVGTRGGINKLDPGYKKFAHYHNNPKDPESLSFGLIFAVTTDRAGSVWVGFEGSGLDRLDLATGKASHFVNDPKNPSSLSSNTISSLYADEDGAIWVGTSSGLNYLEPGSGVFTRYPNGEDEAGEPVHNSITAISRDPDGFLWLGTNARGLVKFDPQTRQPVAFYPHDEKIPTSLSYNFVSTLWIDSDGQIWAGTPSGLDRLDLETGKFVHYRNDANDPASLSDNYVMSIYRDHSGTLWVGTMGGLNKFDPASGSFRQYRMKDGLPNEYVYDILEDEQGFLWMSTNKGLSRFDPRTETFRNYDVRDGLQSNEFNINAAHKTTDGVIFFGGINGLTVFHPEEIRENPYVPPVVLTSLTMRGEPLAPQTTAESIQEVALRWPDNQFEFEFAALSFSRPERNLYAYKLEGFDTEWNYLGSSYAGRYTNLPGKTYTLQLKGANNDSVWNEQGTAIKVTVIPPLWATWWFRGGAALLVISGIVGGYRLRVNRIKDRNLELEEMVQERTREIERLFEQTKELAIIEERNRLARDLHDSAKQKAFAALAQIGATRGILLKNGGNAKIHLDEAENLVYEVIQELTFLIQEMYPLALKEKGLITALREYTYEWESRTDIKVDLHVEGGRRLHLQIEQAIYRVTQESLANIARHSKASQVEITVIYKTESIEVTIFDNGRGFDLNQKPTGVGLRTMHERMAMIHGELKIETAPGQGTRVMVYAPSQFQPPEAAQYASNGGKDGQSHHDHSG